MVGRPRKTIPQATGTLAICAATSRLRSWRRSLSQVVASFSSNRKQRPAEHQQDACCNTSQKRHSIASGQAVARLGLSIITMLPSSSKSLTVSMMGLPSVSTAGVSLQISRLLLLCPDNLRRSKQQLFQRCNVSAVVDLSLARVAGCTHCSAIGHP